MNQKHYELLNLFLNRPNAQFTYASLAAQMNVSDRSIRNYIAELNDFLQENRLPPIIVTPDKKLRLSDSESALSKLPNILNNLGLYQYSLSQQERVIAIYLLLICSPQITIQGIANELGISKKTCVNDMKDVMLEFEKAGVSFISTSRGYRTEISERFRRELIFQKLCNQIDIFNPGLAQSGLRTWIMQYFQLHIHNEFYPVVADWLQDHHLELDGRSFTRFNLFIAISIYRIQQRFFVQASPLDVQEIAPESFALAEDLSRCLTEAIQVVFPEPEVHYMADLVNRIIFPEHTQSYWHGVDIHLIIRVFLTGISQSLGINLTEDTLLQEQLTSHIKATLNRLTNGDLLTNHFKEELILKNEEVYHALKDHISVLEKSFHCKFDEDALAYVMLHIIASVERNYIAQPVRAYIVCNAGVASGIYLTERLRNYCRLDIISSIPAHKLQPLLDSSLEKPDLIITVIPLSNQTLPVVKISPLPTEKDFSLIQDAINMVLQKRRTSIFAPPVSEPSLPSFLSSPTHSLRELFSPELVLTDCRADTWQEAIRQAGSPLVKSGCVSDDYLQQIIQNVEINGPYFVLFPGIALAHAAPPSPDIDFCASIARFNPPVHFHHENNDPVYYVITFVSSDRPENHEKLFSLISLFSNIQYLQSFLNAETAKEFLRLLGYPQQEDEFPAD